LGPINAQDNPFGKTYGRMPQRARSRSCHGLHDDELPDSRDVRYPHVGRKDHRIVADFQSYNSSWTPDARGWQDAPSMDAPRKLLVETLERRPDLDLKNLSLMIGRNHAY
jgi:hypothetical protein